MKGQFNSASAREIILAWKPRLQKANIKGSFEESDFNSAANHLSSFTQDPDSTLTQFFLAIERNDPHLAADLAQKILLEESLEVKS